MKIWQFFLLTIIFLCTSYKVVAMNPLEKQKGRFFTNSWFTRDSAYEEEFQLSLKMPSSITSKWNNLLAGIPAIGNYQSTGYEFRTRLALIELDPANAKMTFPESLKRVLGQYAGYSLNTYIMITGRGLRDFRYYNMVFHPVVAVWQGLKIDFSVNVLMGIFGPDGIVQYNPSIAFDSLSSQNVYPHDGGVYLSPDNARFALAAGRSLTTFWSAVVSDSTQKNIVITFHILVNDANLEDAFKNHIEQSNNLGQLIENLGKIQLTNQADAQALHNALVTIRSIATGVPAQSVSIPVPTPTPALTTVVSNQRLQQELQNLKSRLIELQRALG